ncbi:hypothetical protein RFI_08490 [Reticulomyxa filosa]|uniref:Serine aminopeptidase S33 domain-containing protein n=1 Tax=Reticulomyxa filosa TaxID=46433 RepID=X6NTL6_RETFI|nr:hypothetical protein RFI_08490 [Reticulomyxa filosa]|eukprot:ETO28642.1 hypothetical protein RFI_08490 [Reticulomyxa filosa]
MVQIQQENVTKPWLITLLSVLSKVIPDAPWVPSRDLRDFSCKDKAIIKYIKSKPVTWEKNPRLGTAMQFLRQCQDLQEHLEDIHIPLLIMHGKQDRVTSYEMSIQCYEKAGSKDKEIKIYENAWHFLFVDQWKQQVFDDIDAWISQRQGHIFRASRYQMLSLQEKKQLQTQKN